MHPFYFGSGTRRLFGIYEPSRLARSKPRAVLLCYPWGAEYLHAHKSMRALAGSLAEAGIDSLRFDYFATGDSSGDDAEGDLAGWRQDILTAADELMSLASVSRITLVGLRLGATLAAQVSASLAHEVESVVLWDPIVDGPGYIQELYAIGRAQSTTIGEPEARPASIGGGVGILGFPLTERILGELRGVSLASIAAQIPCPVSAVVSESDAACQLTSAALKLAPSMKIEHIASPSIWIEQWRAGVVPAKTLQQIVQWIAQ